MDRAPTRKAAVVNLLRAVAAAILALTPTLAWAGSGIAAAAFVYPLMDTRVSSGYGQRVHPTLRAVRHHKGVDLAAPKGAPIRAVWGGTVVFADPFSHYGNLIVIKHADGLTSHYGHLESFKVKPGQKVRAGQMIGAVGSTGRVTGPHLHLEVRKDGVPLNPQRYLPGLESDALG